MAEVEGFGTTLEYGNQSTYSGSTTWTAVAEVADIEPPTIELADIQTTHHLSPSKAHEFQAGLRNGGEGKVTVHFSSTAHTTLMGLIGTSKGWRINFNNPGTTSPSRLGFDGYIKSIGPKTPLEGIVTTELTIKVSGLPTYVEAV